MSDNEYWLVAVPGDATPEDSWGVVSDKVKNHAGCFKFPIPELKVRTLLGCLYGIATLMLACARCGLVVNRL